MLLVHQIPAVVVPETKSALQLKIDLINSCTPIVRDLNYILLCSSWLGDLSSCEKRRPLRAEVNVPRDSTQGNICAHTSAKRAVFVDESVCTRFRGLL